jgi:hypothetical protein
MAQPPGTRWRRTVPLLLATLAVGGVMVAVSGPAEAGTTLGASAAESGRYFSTGNDWIEVAFRAARAADPAAEVQSSSTADGARIVQKTDTGATNQQWQLIRMG